MKNLACYLLLLLGPAVAHAQSPVVFTLKGTIGTLHAPATIYLLRDGRLDEKVTLQHGTFELTGTLRSPQSVMLSLSRTGQLKDVEPRDHLPLFLEKGPIVVTGSAYLSQAHVTGSALTAEYQHLQMALSPLNHALYELYSQRQAITKQSGAPATVQRLTTQIDSLTQQQNHQLAAYLLAHPDSYVSLDALQKIGGPVPRYAVVAPLYQTLSAPVRQSLAGQDYAALLQVIREATATAPASDTAAVERAVAKYQVAQAEHRLQERHQDLRAFIHAHPGAAASLDAVRELGGPNPDYTTQAPLFASLAPALRTSPAGKAYAQELAARKVFRKGQLAPDFTQPTPDGRPVSLQDYRGKYVLVDFWASWCIPCRAENPHLVAAYQAYQAKGFDIVSISLDEPRNRAQWLAAIQADQLPWTHVSDLQKTTAKRYQVQAIPQNFLVDPTGHIIATELRGEALQAQLAQVFK